MENGLSKKRLASRAKKIIIITSNSRLQLQVEKCPKKNMQKIFAYKKLLVFLSDLILFTQLLYILS